MSSQKSNVIAFENPGNQILVLKVILIGTKPKIWRRLEVPSSFTLGDMHYVIQIAMGWENSHLHAFRVGNRSYSIPMEDDPDARDEDSDSVTLAKLKLGKSGSKFFYEYDFGDSWEHEITIESVKKRNSEHIYPRCLKAIRACPLEDSGGIPGYENLLRILRNPKHPEYEDYLEWAGDDFDPKLVNIGEINELLANEFAT